MEAEKLLDVESAESQGPAARRPWMPRLATCVAALATMATLAFVLYLGAQHGTVSGDVQRLQRKWWTPWQKPADVVLGIDMGTSGSYMAVYKDEKVEIIKNNDKPLTPSYVSFAGKDPLVGEAARDKVKESPTQSLYNVKRLMGRDFNDAEVQKMIKFLPYKIVEKSGKPMISVNDKLWTPEDVSSLLLADMRAAAGSQLNQEVKKAVITVPGYSNDAQRRSMMAAAKKAGFTDVELINKGTADALDYAFRFARDEMKIILVYDLGGGFFDATLAEWSGDGFLEVLGTAGDTTLGGEDFTDLTTQDLLAKFKHKHGKDMDPGSAQTLRIKVAEAIQALSSSKEVQIQMDVDGADFKETLTREKFEALNIASFQNTLESIDKVLEHSGRPRSDVDEIVLAGSSSHIPKVEQLVKDYFHKEPKMASPFAARAAGAAIMGTLKGNSDMLVLDVMPLTVGVQEVGGTMMRLIERSSTIPIKKSETWTTSSDNQPKVTIKVYEGERALAKDNHCLAEFDVTGIPPQPRGKPQIEVEFAMDKNAILTASAKDKVTKKKFDIVRRGCMK
ncbi:hsp-3 [Symbiodinium natans]|uniref:Hsp-3 protein n=1 Tax=Symbiodinium natans TaxID=878477 RepID=A0A812N8B3_9DINO|nr:hsp-3 [Symbiodinium natans]